MGVANGLDYILDAAKVLQQRCVQNISILLHGDGAERARLESRCREENIDGIEFSGPSDKYNTAQLVSRADVCLTIFKDIPVLSTCSPNKFFDSLAAGKPVIVNTPGWLQTLVEHNHCGFYVRPDRPEVLADRLQWLAKNRFACAELGHNARKLAEREFARDAMVSKVETVLLGVNEQPVTASAYCYKRIIDVIAAAIALVIGAPLMLVLYGMVRLRLGRPVIFRQQRIGRNGRSFTIYKFRTLRDTRDESGDYLPDEQRITAFGRWLRSAGMDELPQLWNVLRGDMSLIGPRPLLPEYLNRYSAFEARRHEVRPGITGWAQVKGRNGLGWAEQFRLDVWYVDHCGLALDLRIFFLTAKAILTASGSEPAGSVTKPVFLGSDHGHSEA
jgi:lipopolysaccharide/colanic/teichoic acid biosynthesis glycosyltransferase